MYIDGNVGIRIGWHGGWCLGGRVTSFESGSSLWFWKPFVITQNLECHTAYWRWWGGGDLIRYEKNFVIWTLQIYKATIKLPILID